MQFGHAAAQLNRHHTVFVRMQVVCRMHHEGLSNSSMSSGSEDECREWPRCISYKTEVSAGKTAGLPAVEKLFAGGMQLSGPSPFAC